MKRLRVRALVLAAGRGERLQPLSGFLPKPLLPVAGRPVCSHALAALERLRCQAAALNLYHLGPRIRAELGERYGEMPLVYSQERELLGTLGALRPLREFLAPAPHIVVVNGDSLCRWPLARLIHEHLRSGAAATLLFARRAPVEEFGGGVAIAPDGGILAFRAPQPSGESPRRSVPPRRRRVFAGAHVLSPELLERLPAGKADCVTDLYEPLLAEGARIQALETSRPWFDLGTPRRYLEAALAWAADPWPLNLLRRSAVAVGATVERGARVRASVVERGCRIGSAARVERSLLLPRSDVADGGRLRECILGPGVEVGAGVLERSLVTLPLAGADPERPLARGGLVLTSLD